MVSQQGDSGWNRTDVRFDINPNITHLAHEKVYPTTGVHAPYSLRTAAWVLFRVPQESEQ